MADKLAAIVRDGRVCDIPAIDDMARAHHEASGISFAKYNAGHIRDLTARLIDSPTGYVGVLDFDGPSGVLLAEVHRAVLLPVMIATEFMWWVDKGARGYGGSMIDPYLTWAKENGARAASICDMSERMEKFMVREGFQRFETRYAVAL